MADKLFVMPGEWYLCAICRACEMPIPILWVEPGEYVPSQPIGKPFAFRDVPCQNCGAKNDYPLHELKKLQAQEPAGGSQWKM